MFFIADLIACSTCFRHHYAHHQELKGTIQLVAACGIWCFGFQVVGMVCCWGLCVQFATDNLKTKAPNTIGSNQLYNTLELLMMGIMVPETCWESNNICNKKHLLHLVGIYFHILTTMHGQNHFKLISFLFNIFVGVLFLIFMLMRGNVFTAIRW